jgi:hypothetical protein
MIRLLRWSGPAIMLAVCLALGYVVQDEIAREAGLPPIPSAKETQGRAAPPPRLAVPAAAPISDFSETLTRPLFHESRKPAPEVAAPTPETPSVEQPPLQLVGVVIVPEGRSALIRMPRSKELVEVLVGERIEGWRLESIETDRIVLKSGEASATYRIDADPR